MVKKQYAMPLTRDLKNCKKYKVPAIFSSPFAVFVKKMASNVRSNWIQSLDLNKSLIQQEIKDYPNFEILVNFQYKNKTKFKDSEMKYLELVQQIKGLKYLCIPEKDFRQSSNDFSTFLEHLMKRNLRKQIVPILEPYSEDLLKKLAFIKKSGITHCGVIFRGFNNEKDKANLSRIIANLKALNIQVFVFGVFPSKFKKSNATMLYPALHFQADYVSTWIAWGGRKAPMRFLGSGWTMDLVEEADEGLAQYGEYKRKDFLSGKRSITFNTALSQIDLINQATLLKEIRTLPEIEFKKLFF